jgi:hypothetical protein
MVEGVSQPASPMTVTVPRPQLFPFAGALQSPDRTLTAVSSSHHLFHLLGQRHSITAFAHMITHCAVTFTSVAPHSNSLLFDILSKMSCLLHSALNQTLCTPCSIAYFYTCISCMLAFQDSRPAAVLPVCERMPGHVTKSLPDQITMSSQAAGAAPVCQRMSAH